MLNMANFLHAPAPTFQPSKLIYEFILNIYTSTHTISRRTISNIYRYIWYLQHIWYANQLKHDFGIRLAYPRAQCRQLWIPTVQGNITSEIPWNIFLCFVLNFPIFKIEFKIVWPYIIILELVWKHLNLCFKKFVRSVTPSPFLNYMSAFWKLFI